MLTLGTDTVMHTGRSLREQTQSGLTRHTKWQLSGTGVSTHLTVTMASQYTHGSNHHIAYPKYIQFLLVKLHLDTAGENRKNKTKYSKFSKQYSMSGMSPKGGDLSVSRGARPSRCPGTGRAHPPGPGDPRGQDAGSRLRVLPGEAASDTRLRPALGLCFSRLVPSLGTRQARPQTPASADPGVVSKRGLPRDCLGEGERPVQGHTASWRRNRGQHPGRRGPLPSCVFGGSAPGSWSTPALRCCRSQASSG